MYKKAGFQDNIELNITCDFLIMRTNLMEENTQTELFFESIHDARTGIN